MGHLEHLQGPPILEIVPAPEIFADEIAHIDVIGDMARFVLTAPGPRFEEESAATRHVKAYVLFPVQQVPHAIAFTTMRLGHLWLVRTLPSSLIKLSA